MEGIARAAGFFVDETKVSATLIDATSRWLIDGNFTMKKAFAALFVLLSLVASTQAFAGKRQRSTVLTLIYW